MILDETKEENNITSVEEARKAGAAEEKKSEDKKPEDKKSEKKKSEDKKPEDKKSEDKKSEEKKPEDKKPEDKKPEDKKPEEKKSEDKKPEDKKSEEKKSEEKKPEDDKAAASSDGGIIQDKDFKPLGYKAVPDESDEKKKVPLALKIVLAVLGVIVVVYLAFTIFFIWHFSFNYHVNGLDVSFMSLDDVNQCLRAKKGNDYRLSITEDGQETASLTDSDLNSTYDYSRELQRLKAGDQPYAWPVYAAGVRSYDIDPDLIFDEANAKQKILSLTPVKYTPNEHPNNVKIMKSQQNGFILISSNEIQPDQDKLVDLIVSSLKDVDSELALNEADYSISVPHTESQNDAIDFFAKIDAIQNTKLVFVDHGQEMQIGKDMIADTIRVDSEERFIVNKEGEPTFDDALIGQYGEEIGTAFTSKDTNMWWHKYNGGSVSVNSGTYGKTVDTPAVTKRIESCIKNCEDYEGAPDYIVEEDRDPNAPDEIGDTYIEVDMTRQKLYYIKDGKLFMTSDVVTGNKGRHHDTTQLMAYIYYMQRDRVLVGEDYRTPVKYWMAFHNHEGLHDANWRRSFGGDIYKYNGSHGCVNLPTSFAAELYDNVYVGLPVITYY